MHDLGALRAAGARRIGPSSEQLDRATRAAESRVQLARADLKPTLSLGVDAGTQGEEYEFGRGRNFSMISLVLNWQFFDGGANRAEARERARRRAPGRHAARRSRAADPARSAAGARSAWRPASDSLATARSARRGRARRLPHRRPQARRRRHQPGGVHRRAQQPHGRRAQSQRHAASTCSRARPSSTTPPRPGTLPLDDRHGESIMKASLARSLVTARRSSAGCSQQAQPERRRGRRRCACRPPPPGRRRPPSPPTASSPQGRDAPVVQGRRRDQAPSACRKATR